MKNQNSNLKAQSERTLNKCDLRYRCYQYSIRVIQFVGTLPSSKVFWVIIDQLLRSATSIGANIIEAKSASSRKDFRHFYEIALKSANETKYWLCLLRDATNSDKQAISELLQEVNEIARMLGSSIMTLKSKKS